jgi:ParB-like chromosome segregation protein Spo0J
MAALHRSVDAWPRFALDEERVADFAELYRADGADALPPIEIIGIAEGYLVADGRHRVAAAFEAGLASIPAVARSIDGRDPIEVAFEIGLESSANASKPLTRAEKRAAIRRLLNTGRTDREIARMVGVAHTTVSRVRDAEQGSARHDSTDDALNFEPGPTIEQIARRMASAIEKLWDARGLTDVLLGDRMGRHLAEAFEDRFGDDAASWARRFARWANDAARRLG